MAIICKWAFGIKCTKSQSRKSGQQNLVNILIFILCFYCNGFAIDHDESKALK